METPGSKTVSSLPRLKEALRDPRFPFLCVTILCLKRIKSRYSRVQNRPHEIEGATPDPFVLWPWCIHIADSQRSTQIEGDFVCFAGKLQRVVCNPKNHRPSEGVIAPNVQSAELLC